MINDKDRHIPLPLIMFTCTALLHALLQWQKNKCVHLKASNSELKADRPDHSNYFNHNNEGGKIAFCCAVTGRKLLTSPAIADTYTFLMNTWNTLPESYQQRVYNNTLATASVRSNRRRIQRLPWWSAWKQRMLTMLFSLIIWQPKWRLRSLGPEALTQTSR